MKTSLIISIAAITSAIAIIAIGYSYNTYKASEAKNICQAINSELEALKAEGKKLSTGKVQVVKNKLIDCKVALQGVPFKSEDIQKTIIKIDDADKQITGMMPMIAIAEALQNAFKPSQATNLGQPTQSTKFDNLKPCQRLDVLAKSGQSIANYLDASDDSTFKAYQNAIKTSCNWHQSQLDMALAKWQAKQPKPAASASSAAPKASEDNGSFLGIASTGESVYLISASRINTIGGEVSYQIGSDVVSGYVNCQTNTINTAADGSFAPQSQAIQGAINAVCR